MLTLTEATISSLEGPQLTEKKPSIGLQIVCK